MFMKFNTGENISCSSISILRKNFCLRKQKDYSMIITFYKNLLIDCCGLLSIYCKPGSMQTLFYLILIAYKEDGITYN